MQHEKRHKLQNAKAQKNKDCKNTHQNAKPTKTQKMQQCKSQLEMEWLKWKKRKVGGGHLYVAHTGWVHKAQSQAGTKLPV